MTHRFPEHIEDALTETKDRLQHIYTDRLREILLFGSYARGDYKEGSDIDLLVLLDHVNDPMTERELYLPVVYDLSLKYDTVLSVISMDYATYYSQKTPLILNVHREGVRI